MKNILITGASRGIGRAIALELGRVEGNLFLNSLTGGEKLEDVRDMITNYRRENGVAGNVLLCPGDVGDPAFVKRMFDKIEDDLRMLSNDAGPADFSGKDSFAVHRTDSSGYGNNEAADRKGIDILINNAGISHIGLIQDMTVEEWERIISVNLSSVHYCCRAAIPHMLAAGEGRIINVSSVWGVVGASCETAYSATKGGVNAYTKALAKELAPSNIAVNAIACGCIDTDMNRHFDPEERKELCEEIPAGRFAGPEEVAKLAAALCGQSTYLTGQVIGFDGGWI